MHGTSKEVLWTYAKGSTYRRCSRAATVRVNVSQLLCALLEASLQLQTWQLTCGSRESTPRVRRPADHAATNCARHTAWLIKLPPGAASLFLEHWTLLTSISCVQTPDPRRSTRTSPRCNASRVRLAGTGWRRALGSLSVRPPSRGLLGPRMVPRTNSRHLQGASTRAQRRHRAGERLAHHHMVYVRRRPACSRTSKSASFPALPHGSRETARLPRRACTVHTPQVAFW